MSPSFSPGHGDEPAGYAAVAVRPPHRQEGRATAARPRRHPGSTEGGTIFGPVLSILLYDTEEEAVAIASDTPYGLAGAV
ncbi:aldehyde dehydrogenase family protein [Streptomyces sp. IBSBF 3136]|uniref:aldehyde dehydrogenase family protein n=1 Tax=Streptomyces sp. IBSBF 3136 TaxID=2903524 RepID=UPI003FA7B9A7